MAEPPEAEPPQEERQQVNPQVLKCIIEHTFLPPKLPGGSDKAPSYETDLVELFQRSLESLKSQVSSEDASLLDTALNTLCASKNCHDEKGLINVDNFKPAVEALISATDPQCECTSMCKCDSKEAISTDLCCLRHYSTSRHPAKCCSLDQQELRRCLV